MRSRPTCVQVRVFIPQTRIHAQNFLFIRFIHCAPLQLFYISNHNPKIHQSQTTIERRCNSFICILFNPLDIAMFQYVHISFSFSFSIIFTSFNNVLLGMYVLVCIYFSPLSYICACVCVHILKVPACVTTHSQHTSEFTGCYSPIFIGIASSCLNIYQSRCSVVHWHTTHFSNSR